MPFIYVYLFCLAMFCCFLIAYSVYDNTEEAKAHEQEESDPFSSKNYPTLHECGITEEDKPS